MKKIISKFSTPLIIWGLSRLIIVLAMLIIAPHLPAPPGGIKADFSLDVFAAWDTEYYELIATQGYTSTPNTLNPLLAFFPLFPLLIRGLMTFGLPFKLSGILINNLAFLLTTCLLYHWMEEQYSRKTARWITCVLAFFPLSLYGSVIYTEGLFLLSSTAAMYCFEKEKYISTAIWGSLATATRITGLALIPAFICTAWREKRHLKAYLSGIFSTVGLLCYSLYCWLEHASIFAFLEVQKNWQPENFVWGRSWLKMFGQLTIGHINIKEQSLRDPYYPLIFFLLTLLIYLGCKYRARINTKIQISAVFIAILLMWIIGGDAFINLTTVFGSIYLLWRYKDSIALSPVLYSLFSFLIIFSSGRTASAERYVYGIISSSICFGLLLDQKQRFVYPVLSIFGILLFLFSIRFSQHLWVA